MFKKSENVSLRKRRALYHKLTMQKVQQKLPWLCQRKGKILLLDFFNMELFYKQVFA